MKRELSYREEMVQQLQIVRSRSFKLVLQKYLRLPFGNINICDNLGYECEYMELIHCDLISPDMFFTKVGQIVYTSFLFKRTNLKSEK